MKYQKDLRRFIRDGDYEVTEGGILVHSAIMARGTYVHSVNGGQDEQRDHNLIPTQGIAHILAVIFGATAKITTWYLALQGGNVTPAAGWTAANYAANASEINNSLQGYTEATRQAFVPGAVSGGKIGNLASRAVFTIAASTPLSIYGAALLSSSTRGGTTGVLASASRFATTRVQNNGDTFECGYEIELTDS